MNRVVFVALDARFTHSNPAVRSILAYLEANIDPHLLPEIIFLEQNINQSKEFILNKIVETQADACFFSAYIWNIELIKEIIGDLHRLCPDLLIGAGGPELAYSAQSSLEEIPGLDLVSTGEGELAYARLLPLIAQVSSQSQTDNQSEHDHDFASFRKQALAAIREDKTQGFTLSDSDGGYIVIPEKQELDLARSPFLYSNGLEDLSHRYVYYESSRGCPFNCSYCLSSLDKSLRLRDLDLVEKELLFFMDQDVSLVKFIDRSFNADIKRARELWSFLITQTNRKLADDPKLFNAYQKYLAGERKYPPFTRFHFEVEARLLQAEDFELLKQAPKDLFQFEVGIQSFNPKVLKSIRRSQETKPILDALVTLADFANIHCHADLIFGLTNQDLESIGRSFRIILTSKADHIQLGFLKVLKGTQMEIDARDRSFVWEERAPYEVLQTDLLSYQDLVSLKHLEAVFDRFMSGTILEKTRELVYLYNQEMARQDMLAFGLIKPDQALESSSLTSTCFEFNQENNTIAQTNEENLSWDSFDFFLRAGQFFYANGLLDRPISQDEFFIRFYDFVLAYGFTENSNLASAIREDYLNLPRGNLSTWDKLRDKFPSALTL